jgi:penicillin-binding protein 2
MIVNKPTIKKKKKISRYTVLSIIMCIIFSIITFRLLYLQVYSYEEYKERADVTSTRFVAEKAPRGKIYDQKGIVLATNKQTYTITYTKTDEADKQLYSTMKQLFKILDENGEKVQDTLPLKIDSNNKIYFQYKSDKKESQDYEDLRFKKDRGINDILRKTMFKGVEELSDAQNTQLDQALLKVAPEEAFYDLVKSYNLIELIDPEYKSKEKTKIYTPMSGKELADLILAQGYSLNDIRKFMLIKDAIKMQSFKGYRAVTIAENIQRNTSLIVLQKRYDLPGIDVSLTPIREYPFNNLASSVLGYLSSVTDNQKEKYELKGYDISSDLIGISGIESAFEEQLKGVKGGTTIKVNSQGTKTQELFKLESYPGKDVHLTIDSGIQYASEQAFSDGIKNIVNTPDGVTGYRYLNATRGALIATEVKTGRILSLVSYPNFNPNLFAVQGQLTNEQNSQYFNPDLNAFGQELIQRMGLNKTVNDLFPLNSDGHTRSDRNELYPSPTYNYATMAKIPPGSTFKPLTALAGLESGVNTPDTVIVDKGEYREHPEIFGKDFAPKGLEAATGPTTLTRAIAESINYYFYETGYKLYMQAGGPANNTEALDALAKYAWQFGLGRDPKGNQEASTGIEIGESFGQAYNFQSWKENIIAFSKYNLVEALDEKGEYNGKSFIKFDIRVSDNDKEVVKKAKQSIKDKVSDSLSKVGIKDAKMMTHDEFLNDVKKDVKTIMENSDVYKQRVSDEEASGRKVNLEAQAFAVSEAIAQFTINDQAVQIKSPAQIVYASIGQGMNNFTPLQLVSYISTLANGGTRYKLHLVDKITDNEGKVIQEFKPEVLNTVPISKSTQEAIKKGMMAVNNGEDGTAKAAFAGFPITTAGKTGTADASEDQRERGRSPYATYVSYAPAEDPEIAVVAVVFDGGHGSSIAPAVRAVYEAYFKDKLLKDDPNYASKSPSFQKYVVESPISKK